ncbi:MAG: MgtC/SapB family protein [Syntrophobacteraceae bacterium]
MTKNLTEILAHLVVAMAAGGMIGLERSYNGHSAGFRTHTLVCMASSVLMLVAIYQTDWFAQTVTETVRIDPTRMAQGIMTGIGFLGAGVIMRDGLSIRGLTTAASIWITAAIGILAGVGFYWGVAIVIALTLGTLTIFRWIESRLPTLSYAQCSLRLAHKAPLSETDLRDVMAQHGFDIVHLSYSFAQDAVSVYRYDMRIRTRKQQNFEGLARTLTTLDQILEFRISLTGD